MRDSAANNTAASFTAAAACSCQFRLTANTKPAMTVGSSSSTVEHVKNEGKDWFFKLHAVGKVGDGCKFYVNSAPVLVAVAHIA